MTDRVLFQIPGGIALDDVNAVLAAINGPGTLADHLGVPPDQVHVRNAPGVAFEVIVIDPHDRAPIPAICPECQEIGCDPDCSDPRGSRQ